MLESDEDEHQYTSKYNSKLNNIETIIGPWKFKNKINLKLQQQKIMMKHNQMKDYFRSITRADRKSLNQSENTNKQRYLKMGQRKFVQKMNPIKRQSISSIQGYHQAVRKRPHHKTLGQEEISQEGQINVKKYKNKGIPIFKQFNFLRKTGKKKSRKIQQIGRSRIKLTPLNLLRKQYCDLKIK